MYIETKTIDAIDFAGNKSKLADMLEITRQSLTSWGDYLPQSSATKLYILTNGKIGNRVDSDEDDKRADSEPKVTDSMFYP